MRMLRFDHATWLFYCLLFWNFTSLVAGTSKPLTCSFESSDSPLCQWQQVSEDNFDWTRHNGYTATSGTGPQYGDHTSQSSSGYYLYTEASSKNEGLSACIISPIIDPLDSSCAMTFYYNMYGASIGFLHVYTTPVDAANGGETNVWSLAGSQGINWHKAVVTFNVTYQFQVIVEGVRGSTSRSDIAIDDTSFSQSCEKVEYGNLRIIPDTSSTDVNQGRVDVYLNGVWGSICDRNFDFATDGVVACIQLGYRMASSSIYSVAATNLPLLDNIQCFGNETNLLDCENDGIGVIDGSCNVNRVVNLKCSDIIDICEDLGSDAFHCDNIHCIPSGEKCDFSNHCGDNSDEASSICDIYPGRNSFQTDYGEWSQPETNSIDWSRTNGLVASGGPSKDHNDIIDEYFLVLDGSNVGMKAQLCLDMNFQANPTNCSIRFYYYRNSRDTGVIDFIQRTSLPTKKWTISSTYESSSQWDFKELKITSSESFHICFEATISSAGIGYLGLDDLSLTPGCIIGSGECELTGPTFTCNNGLCIHAEYLCDHIHNCLDASDENTTLCQQRVGYCNFQDGFCDWQQSLTDQLNWMRHSGDTPTSSTGPVVDHTFGNHFGYYAYLEVSGKAEAEYCDLLSPWLTFNQSCELRLFYHMDGNNIGNIQIGTITRTTPFTLLFTERISRDDWRISSVFASNNVQIHVDTEFQFVIRATVGNGIAGDVAIDDLSLSEDCIPVPVPTTISPLTTIPEPPPTTSKPQTSTPEPPTTTSKPPTSTPEPPTTTSKPPTSTPELSSVNLVPTTSTPVTNSMSPTGNSESSFTTTQDQPSMTPKSVPRERTTSHPNDTSMTMMPCNLYRINQQSSYCNDGYKISCQGDGLMILVQLGMKSCSWTIKTEVEHVLKLMVIGMSLPLNDELKVGDEGNSNPVIINNENKEWTSHTAVIQVHLNIQTRLKRDTQIMTLFEIQIQSQSLEEPTPRVLIVIAVLAVILLVICIILAVVFRNRICTNKPGLPYELPRVQYRRNRSIDYNDTNVNSIYNPSVDNITLMKSQNGFVDLPPNLKHKQTAISKTSVNNEYAEMNETTYDGKLPTPPTDDYLVPCYIPSQPPTYEEICPERNPNGFDNHIYHGPREGNIYDKKVYEFLKDLNLQKYLHAFESEFVVYDDIPYIEADELEDMGLDKNEKKRFLRRAKQYGKKQKPISQPEDPFGNVTVPSKFLCPMSRQVMKQPVIAADNVTYDYENINVYLKSNTKSPVTDETLANKSLSPNIEITDQIQKFKVKIDVEKRRNARKMRREKSDLSQSRPQTPMTDIDC